MNKMGKFLKNYRWYLTTIYFKGGGYWWIIKDIESFISQSERAFTAVHCFIIYQIFFGFPIPPQLLFLPIFLAF